MENCCHESHTKHMGAMMAAASQTKGDYIVRMFRTEQDAGFVSGPFFYDKAVEAALTLLSRSDVIKVGIEKINN